MALFIGNIDLNVCAYDLYRRFHKFGDILDIHMNDKHAFLSFREQASAEDAINQMHGIRLNGRNLTVKACEFCLAIMCWIS
jgi:RNA recognition motif-containing protein